jgi:hypothetical protein
MDPLLLNPLNLKCVGAGSLWSTVSKLLFGPYHVFFHRLCIAYACQQMSGP